MNLSELSLKELKSLQNKVSKAILKSEKRIKGEDDEEYAAGDANLPLGDALGQQRAPHDGDEGGEKVAHRGARGHPPRVLRGAQRDGGEHGPVARA